MSKLPQIVTGPMFAALLSGAVGCEAKTPPPTPAPANGVSVVQFEVTTPSSLPRCTAALAGTTAYVASPTGLWSCIAGTWVPLPCANLVGGAVAYASQAQTLVACVSGNWTPIPLPQGLPGAPGPQGPQGDAGVNGISILVISTPEPAGTNCPSGGVKLEVGSDTDRDAVLAAGEVTNTSFVCNGSAGTSARVARFDDDGCDPTVVPDDDHAVFVDGTNGDDDLGTGDAIAPVKSLDVGIGIAVALGKTSLYLNEGTYVSSPTLPAASALYIEGSWRRTASGGWQRDCAPSARDSTVIRGPLVAKGMNAGLRSLTVVAEAHYSNIAVSALAGGLAIRDAVLRAGPAKGGGFGRRGSDGSPGSGTTSAACDDGMNGRAADIGAIGAPGAGGTFSPDGTFVPGQGSPGLASGAQEGANGTTGATASCTSVSCVAHFATVTTAPPECATGSCNPYSCHPHDCDCTGLFSCPFPTCYDTCYDVFTSCSANVSQSVVVNGACGVGGKGGGPGGGGGGGGASVALAVASGTFVNVAASALFASNGGDGAPGGSGGPGGPGSSGAPISCTDFSCDSDCSRVSTTQTAAAGGKGGDGGPGPSGGPGAGGPSYGVVKLGSAVVRMDAATQISIGAGGIGPGFAPNGPSALVFAAP